jgi:hypothetical protein
MKKLLIAIRPDDIQMMSDALGSEFDVVVCTSFTQAKSSLTENIDLVACGLHFDEGKMFDLLRYVKADEKLKSIPFFCVKGVGGELSPAIFQSIKIATKTMGADGFIDISERRRKYGDEATYANMRNAVHQLLSNDAAS